MFKLVGCTMILVGFFGTGMHICFGYDQRISLLHSLADYFSQIANYIGAERMTVPEAVRLSFEKMENAQILEFGETLAERRLCEEFETAWEQACNCSFQMLSDDERAQIAKLFYKNACLLQSSQKNLFDELADSFLQKAKKEQQQSLEKKRVARSTLSIIGILICIILW